jgi:Protein of unknown function (DUF551)
MTDLNKLRSEFEATPEIKAILEVMTVKFVAGFYVSVGFGIEIYTPYNALLNFAWDLWQEKAKAQAVPEWISVEVQMPESLRNVLVLLDANPAKNQNQMVAHFIPKFTEEYHGDDDWYDYDEDRGCGYVKEGWYANTAYIGDEYSSYFIEEKVTHWKPLKEASESGAEQ